MAAVKIPHGRVWKNGEAMLLLQEWKDKNKQTNKQTKLLSCPRRKSIWQEISVFLRAMLYENRCEDGCKTKIHTLVGAYIVPTKLNAERWEKELRKRSRRTAVLDEFGE